MELDEATRRVAERLERSVIVVDAEWRVAEYSVYGEDPDRAQTGIILRRRASEQARRMIVDADAKQARGAVAVPAFEDVPPQVIVPLRHHGHLYGFLCFAESAPIDDRLLGEYTQSLLEASAHLAAVLALRRIAAANDARSRRRTLLSLFDPAQSTRRDAAEALLADGTLAQADSYTVAIVRCLDGGDGPSERTLHTDRMLRAVLRSSTSEAFGAVDGPDGVAVLPGRPEPERLERTLRHEGEDRTVIGIGRPRHDLASLIGALGEAKVACTAVGRVPGLGPGVVDWGGLGIDRLLLRLPLDDVSPEDLPDGVRRLLAARSEIDLIETLERFLECGGHAPEAAGLLHIHRSTLYYRLDKVREVTGADLADGTVRRDLHIGLRVARLAGLAPAPGATPQG